MSKEPKPYQSWGNGAAMRVSPVAYAFETEVEVLWHARASAGVSHDHPVGIRGAQAIALAVFMARKGAEKETIRSELQDRFEYDLQRRMEDIRPGYTFNTSCPGSVPEAVIAFLDSDSYEDAIRNAVSLGGDSDTLACMAGAIAEAFYGHLPPIIHLNVRKRLPPEFISILDVFIKWHPGNFPLSAVPAFEW